MCRKESFSRYYFRWLKPLASGFWVPHKALYIGSALETDLNTTISTPIERHFHNIACYWRPAHSVKTTSELTRCVSRCRVPGLRYWQQYCDQDRAWKEHRKTASFILAAKMPQLGGSRLRCPIKAIRSLAKGLGVVCAPEPLVMMGLYSRTRSRQWRSIVNVLSSSVVYKSLSHHRPFVAVRY